MEEKKKWYKSKTINFNALYLAVIAILTQGFGIVIDPAVVTAGGVLLNWILRFITKQPIG